MGTWRRESWGRRKVDQNENTSWACVGGRRCSGRYCTWEFGTHCQLLSLFIDGRAAEQIERLTRVRTSAHGTYHLTYRFHSLAPTTIRLPRTSSLPTTVKIWSIPTLYHNSGTTQVNPSLARILDEMTSLAPKARAKAHPEDSVISPYVDWKDPNAKENEEDVRIENEGEKERLRKSAWNQASRGGRLGDDAD